MDLLDGVRADLAALAAFLWPGPCVACGRDLPARAVAGACPACWAALPRRAGPGCPRCDLPAAAPLSPRACPDCRGEPGPAATVAAFVYDGPLVALHRRLKFGGARDLVAPLAAHMAAAWGARAPGLAGGAAVEVVVPVPPDPLRLAVRRRVPRWLARAVAARLGLPCAPRALRKVRPTRALTGGRADARRARLRGAFRARPGRVAGRAVLVVDDVATTGSTLREAARALADAGAAAVFALVLARTPARARPAPRRPRP